MAKEITVQLVTTNTLSTTKGCFHLLFQLHVIMRVTDTDKAILELLLALPALCLEEGNK